MIKRAFKLIFKFLVTIILFAITSYFAFLGWEYLSGGKYVEYLMSNSEIVNLEESFTFSLAEQDIENSKVIMVGEIHGSEQPNIFDFDFFKYLHQNHGVQHYFAELDFVQATLLNRFLISGDEELLNKILKKWVVIQGRNNQSYIDKYQKFYKYYQRLPEDDKFTFIGIDRIQDFKLLTDYLHEFKTDTPLNTINSQDENLRSALMQRLEVLSNYYQKNTDTLYLLNHLKENLAFIELKTNRELILFNNFQKLYKEKQLSSKKVYAFFGIYHVFQYKVNGALPLAAQIRLSNLGLDHKILSFNFLLNDSYMVMSSQGLPEFLRDKGKYTKMAISADNMLVMYIYGIKDFKRMTPKFHKSLIKLNEPNSPYENSNRMSTTFQLLPVTDLFEMNEKGKPYVQYTIFVRNSDWAQPKKP